MRRAAQITVSVVAVLALLAIVAAGFLLWVVHRSFPQYDGEIAIAGLGNEVRVVRDAQGVPTIYADSTSDLFFAQGYVQAQDRFFEMDFRRHVTAGRLAEWFGEDQVDTDTFVRTMGWRRVAELEYAQLDESTQDILDSYSAGVNAYLDDHDGAGLSFEYWLFGVMGTDVKPERWTPADSLAWLKAIAWQLVGNLGDELDRARLLKTLPLPRVNELYPEYPYNRDAPIVSGGEIRRGAYVPPEVIAADNEMSAGATSVASAGGAQLLAPAPPAAASGALAASARVLHLLDDVLGPASDSLGSNSWAVSGSLTSTGKPMLANDPHLPQSMPSIWYQMNLRCNHPSASCPYDVGGYTFAGFPGVIIGHNNRIAWGFTNLDPDVSDLFVERIRGSSYDTINGPQGLAYRSETIQVAGGSPVKVTVRSSSHGPLISDADAGYLDAAGRLEAGTTDAVEYAVALRWTALDPGHTADSVFATNRAASWDEFRAAAALFDVPAQNLVYADVDGNIGYQAPGKIPIRQGGDGRVPALGWTGEGEWTGYLAAKLLPWDLNPKEGFIVTANQAVADQTYPYFLTDDWAYGFRSERIRDLLAAAGTIDLQDMQRIQLDTSNPNAAFLVPQLPKLPDDPFYTPARDLLEGWDYTQPPDSAAAAYFNAFWRNLLVGLFEDELAPDEWPDGGGRWFEVVRDLWSDPTNEWWDDKTTRGAVESRDEIVLRALRDARDELTRVQPKNPATWQWGRMHTLELRNATFGESGIGVIEALFNRGPLRVGGGSGIVDATAWDASQGYEVTAVPSMRMVIDLANLDRSQWVNLTGQSDHVRHAHYSDQIDAWHGGTYFDWAWSAGAMTGAQRHTLALVPPVRG